MIKIQLFSIFGEVLLKDNGATSTLEKIEKKGQSLDKGMGISFKSIASAALKLGAILGAGIGIKSMIETAAKGQDRLAQMDAVLKSTGGAAGMTKDQLVALATAQSKLSTQSKGANMETENLLLTFTNLGKNIFPQCLTTVNDMSQALGQDTKSSAIQLGKALNDPIKGITALSRVGVSFTKQQKDQITTLVKSGKTMEAQKIILKELATEFGGSALAASKTFDGQMTILKNSLVGMGGSIANVVLPYLTSFATWANTNMPKIQAVILGAINYIVPKFKELADFVMKNVTPTFKAMGDWISTNMPLIKGWISDMSVLAVDSFKKIIEVIKQIVNIIFPNLGKGTIDIGITFHDLRNTIYGLTHEAFDILITALTWVRNNIPLVKNVVTALIAVWLEYKLVTIATNVHAAISNGLIAAHKALVIASSIAQGVYNTVLGAYDILMGEGSLATKLATVAQWLWNAALNANPIGLTIIALAALGVAIYELIKHWQDVVTWIQKAWDWLTKWNGSKMADKSTTMTVNHVDNNVTSPGGSRGLSMKAKGDNNWIGGPVITQEAGGEILDLPRGTRIIPHDVSMEMAKNGNGKGGLTLNIGTFINNRKEDIQELMEESAFYMKQKNKGLGV